MTRTRILACCLAVAVALCLSMTDLADAKRLGGGKSFGGSPSYQRSFTPSQPSPSSPASPNLNRQQQTPQPGPATPQQAPRSRFGGFGGILGGMLAGSLIGSLLFGGGFGGVGMMDMLLVALVVFMGLKLFAARRGSTPAPASASGQPGGMRRAADYGAQSGAGWDALRAAPATAADAQPASPGIPEGFDTEDFLRGAKLAYNRLQASWDRRDLDDIAQFTTPEILREITQQAQDDPSPSRTEVLYCNASVLSVTEEKGRSVATVFFDVLMREDAQADAPSQVREVWHFVRTGNEMWRLDGIQQVEM
ncbi:TIM44-like domain-containing protein [Nitratidesulfovibrio sp.]|uniref:Tim44 domain-containing protein n=1 Tax=Nitratidesulfovibrio sp. TaxID=2802297 RepID=UPI0033420093